MEYTVSIGIPLVVLFLYFIASDLRKLRLLVQECLDRPL